MIRIALVAILLAGGAGAAALARPMPVAACSCMAPLPVADYLADPNTIIATGTVASVGGGESPDGMFALERWSKGVPPAPNVQIRGGNGADCGVVLQPGQHLIVVAQWAEGVLSPSLCTPYGDLDTPEGRALLAEAEEALAEGFEPVTPTPEPAPPEASFDPTPFVVGGALLALALLAAVAFVRRTGEPSA